MKVLKFTAILAFCAALVHAAPNIPDPLPKAPEPIEDVLKLQIFLDSKLFGPGKLDGRLGDYTTKALKRYQKSQGLPETEVREHELDLSEITELYTTYTIRPEDSKFVGPVPSKPAGQSKLKYLPYESLLEFLTERFHCSPELLEYINAPKKLNALKTGDEVKVPKVEPFLVENLTQISSQPETPEFQTRHIKIDTREKMLDLFEGEKLLASLPITPGSGYVATPPGTWKIINIVHMPTFRWDKSVLDYGIRSDNYYELPRGPNNPVGIMWIGLNKPGIGIHGTNSPQTIGRSSSAGCIRTANWDTIRLSKMITKGMKVEIAGPKAVPRPAPPVVAAKPKATPAAQSATARSAPPAAIPVAQPVKEKRRWFWKKND